MSPILRRFVRAAIFVCVVAGCQYGPGSLTADAPIDDSPQVPLSAAAPGDSGITAAAESQLPADCVRPADAVYSDVHHEYLLKDYNGKACKLAAASPGGRYLAYVTLDQSTDEAGDFYTDTVYVLDAGSGNRPELVHAARRRDSMSLLEWAADEVLLVWESVWEDAFVLFVYDVADQTVLAKMRSDEMALNWNPGHTAFYVTHSGLYGREVCARQLSGYDLASASALPDFHRLLGLQDVVQDSFGLPYAEGDSLRIEPFAWSGNGKKLWLTITPLAWQGSNDYRYQLQPTEAGVLEFSGTGTEYSVLSLAPDRDYAFQQGSVPEIVSQAYQPSFCP